jgi:hypothetical protein
VLTDPAGRAFTTTMEATSIERSVWEADVRPPYRIEQMP